MVRIKICPKCRSLNIHLRWQSFWFAGLPATYKCHDCGYISFLFPTVNYKDLKKLSNISKTRGKNGTKRKRKMG